MKQIDGMNVRAVFDETVLFVREHIKPNPRSKVTGVIMIILCRKAKKL